ARLFLHFLISSLFRISCYGFRIFAVLLYSPAMLLLIALGGNAVGRPGEEGNIPQQFAATRAAMQPVADLLLAGHRVVITHGNGPQVGNTLRRVEIAARHKV